MICRDVKLLHDATVISGLIQCETKNARSLSFIDLAKNIHSPDIINIGTTFTNDNPEFVFYYTCSGSVLGVTVLSIFVCHMGVGQFAVKLPSQDNLTIKTIGGISSFDLLNSTMTCYAFDTKKPKEHKYIRSYYLQYYHIYERIPINLLPIEIISNPEPEVINRLDASVIKSVKYDHSKLNVHALKEEPFDINIISSSGTVHKFHKIVLAAHSSVLKQMVKESKDELKLDIDDENVHVLKEFLYTGCIEDILKCDPYKSLKLADKFKLNNLCLLLQYPLVDLITSENAIELGILAQKFNMDYLENEVFMFVKENPGALRTDFWKQLNDVAFIKRLFEFVHDLD